MPYKPKRPCIQAGCPDMAVDGSPYCAQHQPPPPPYQQDSKRIDNRPGSTARGYGADWQRLRLMFLRRNPLCAICGRPANEVHHVCAKRDGGGNEWGNLQALCKSCHSRATAREKFSHLRKNNFLGKNIGYGG